MRSLGHTETGQRGGEGSRKRGEGNVGVGRLEAHGCARGLFARRRGKGKGFSEACPRLATNRHRPQDGLQPPLAGVPCLSGLPPSLPGPPLGSCGEQGTGPPAEDHSQQGKLGRWGRGWRGGTLVPRDGGLVESREEARDRVALSVWAGPSLAAEEAGVTQGLGVWGGPLGLQSFPDSWEECCTEIL